MPLYSKEFLPPCCLNTFDEKNLLLDQEKVCSSCLCPIFMHRPIFKSLLWPPVFILILANLKIALNFNSVRWYFAYLYTGPPARLSFQCTIRKIMWHVSFWCIHWGKQIWNDGHVCLGLIWLRFSLSVWPLPSAKVVYVTQVLLPRHRLVWSDRRRFVYDGNKMPHQMILSNIVVNDNGEYLFQILWSQKHIEDDHFMFTDWRNCSFVFVSFLVHTYQWFLLVSCRHQNLVTRSASEFSSIPRFWASSSSGPQCTPSWPCFIDFPCSRLLFHAAA